MLRKEYIPSNFYLTILITLLCFGFTYFFFGFYYVEYEGLFDSFYSGKLTPGLPFRSIYFLGNIGASHLYSYLYEIWPNVEWLSWIFYSYLLLASFMGLYIMAELLAPYTSLTVRALIQVAVYFLIFADHNIHFIYTRVSYMSCGFSLIALVVFFGDIVAIRSRPWLFIFLNLFFTIGTLTRVESATATLSLCFFFGFFYIQNVRQFFRLFLYPSILILSLATAISFDIETTKEFYKQVEPDIEVQFSERENIIPLSAMKTRKDSAVYSMAKVVLWSDPRIMTPTYLRSLIQPEGFIYTDANQWSRSYRDISATVTHHRPLVLISVLLALALLVQYSFRGSRMAWLSWIAFELSFWVLISLQTYTFKVVDRSFVPFIGLFIFCHIVIMMRSLRPRLSFALYPIFFLGTILFIIYFFRLKTESNILNNDLSKYRQNAEMIKARASNKYLILNSSSCDFLFLSNTPFHPFDFSAFKKVYITDGYNIPFLPYYRRYLQKDCNCDMYDYPGFWDYLRKVKDEVIIISDAGKMEIIKNYLQEAHQYTLPVKQDSTAQLKKLARSDSRDVLTDLRAYILDK